MGAVGQHQSAQAQADYQNESARRNYEYANRQRALDWQNQLSVWGVKRNEYQQQVGENFSAADRAYASEQTRLNEQYEAAALQKQDMMAQLIGLTGTNNASERSGRSVQRLDTAALAAFGRNNAIISKNLTSARSAMMQRVYDNNLQLDAANRRAYSNVAVAPTPGIAPPQPVMVAGPSGMGLAAGLLGAAVSGFGTYNSLKAPKAFDNKTTQQFSKGIDIPLNQMPAGMNDPWPTPSVRTNYNRSFF
jgi:hypothetical protein